MNMTGEHNNSAAAGGPSETQVKHGIGAPIALGVLAATAAAGYYFYGSENAAKHRKLAASWSRSFKKEVARQLESVRSIDKVSVSAAVDKALGIYERLRAVDSVQLVRAAHELKTHWKEFSDELASGARERAAAAKRDLKRAIASRKKR